MVIHCAYGSSKDIWVYHSIGLKPEQINIIGKASKKQHSMANVIINHFFNCISIVFSINFQTLTEGYVSHLNQLTSYGGSRPAQGNARMVLPRGGFGGVRQRRSTAKRTTSYPLSSQMSCPNSIISNTQIPQQQPASADSTSTQYYCGFFSKHYHNKSNK